MIANDVVGQLGRMFPMFAVYLTAGFIIFARVMGFMRFAPVLNRKDNSICETLKINSVEYFNDTNEKVGEETPEDLVIEPESILQVKEPRTSVIDGEVTISELDAISEGVSYGKLVKMVCRCVIVQTWRKTGV